MVCVNRLGVAYSYRENNPLETKNITKKKKQQKNAFAACQKVVNC